jgi:hypothetical protein
VQHHDAGKLRQPQRPAPSPAGPTWAAEPSGTPTGAAYWSAPPEAQTTGISTARRNIDRGVRPSQGAEFTGHGPVPLDRKKRNHVGHGISGNVTQLSNWNYRYHSGDAAKNTDRNTARKSDGPSGAGTYCLAKRPNNSPETRSRFERE